MALPDAGNVEDYSEAEMNELLALFESDKSKLTKNQKAAVARYNFKKNKGEPINYRGSAPAAAAAPAAATPPPPAGGSAGDIVAMLSPEMQLLAGKDPATLTKEEKIALAKAKSQAVRAASAAAAPAEPAKPKGPSPEEIAAKKALETPQAKRLQERFADALDGWAMMVDIPYATVKADRIVDVVRYLHMEMGYTYLRNLTATDYPPDRLEVEYNLLKMGTKEEIALRVKLPRHVPGAVVDHTHHKVGLAEDMPSIPSIVRIHPGADWLERETFDLLGIQFTGHPYLVRLMMPDGWVGHPLRKDYDVTKEQFVGLDERGNDIVSFREEDGW
jgi:NADH-quinone oxidoreductase subunit C